MSETKKLLVRFLALFALGIAIVSACDLFDDIRVAIEIGSKGDEAFLPPAGFTIPGMAGTTTSKAASEEGTGKKENKETKTPPEPIYFDINLDSIEGFNLKSVVETELANLQELGVPIPPDTYNTDTGELNLTKIPSPPNKPELDPAKQIALALKKALERITNPAQYAKEFPPDDPKVATMLSRCKEQDIFRKNDEGKNILTLLLPTDVISANTIDPSGQLDAYKGIIDQIRITDTEVIFRGYDRCESGKCEDIEEFEKNNPLIKLEGTQDKYKSPEGVNTLSYNMGAMSILIFDVTPTKEGEKIKPKFPTPTTNAQLAPSEPWEPVDPICQGSLFLYRTLLLDKVVEAREKRGDAAWVKDKDYVVLLETPSIDAGAIPSKDKRLRKFSLEELTAISDTLKKLNFQVAFRLDIDLTVLIDDLENIINDKPDKRPDIITLPVGGTAIRLRYHAFFVTCPQEAALGNNSEEEIKCAE
ncbi:MAG: hypothetical protein Kow0090_15200 [Myxococcota bacterium]